MRRTEGDLSYRQDVSKDSVEPRGLERAATALDSEPVKAILISTATASGRLSIEYHHSKPSKSLNSFECDMILPAICGLAG